MERTDADGEAGRDRIAGSRGYHNVIGVIGGGPGDDVLSGEHQYLRGGLADDVLTGTDLAGNGGDDLLRTGDFQPMTVRFRTSSRPIVADLPGGWCEGKAATDWRVGSTGSTPRATTTSSLPPLMAAPCSEAEGPTS